MNCRKARRRIPDFLNGRLSDADRWDVERHLEKCPACRKEAEIFWAGLLALRAPEPKAEAGGAGGEMDFTEDEWKAAIRKAAAAGPAGREERKAPSARWRPRPAFAYGLALLAVAAAVLIGVRKFPWLVPSVETRPAAVGEAAAGQAGKITPIEEVGNFFTESDIWARNDDVFSRPPLPQTAAGDVPSFTWISPESGLQIVWFVNDEIQLEE